MGGWNLKGGRERLISSNHLKNLTEYNTAKGCLYELAACYSGEKTVDRVPRVTDRRLHVILLCWTNTSSHVQGVWTQCRICWDKPF